VKQKAYGDDVEVHLKTVFQKSYKWKQPTRPDMEKYKTVKGGGKMVPPLTLKYAGHKIDIPSSS